MKKIIAIITPLFLLLTVSAKSAELGMGITAAIHSMDASGTETTRQNSTANTASHSEDAAVPEIFAEAIADNGWAIGLSYIPTRSMGSKSRTDTNAAADTGTYTAKAELSNVVQLYTDIPLPVNFPVHLKLGLQHVTLTTLESLNSGSTYPDANLVGWTVGIGNKGSVPFAPDNMYYKAEVTYTDFDDYSAMSSGDNKLEAELDSMAGKLSIGYKF